LTGLRLRGLACIHTRIHTRIQASIQASVQASVQAKYGIGISPRLWVCHSHDASIANNPVIILFELRLLRDHWPGGLARH